MYSGSTLTPLSGRILGAHQKIDRVARWHLARLAPQASFPTSRLILHFEGDNGPDAIKRKSPAKDEPWHFMQPFDLEDTQLVKQIEFHYAALVSALKKDDMIRASFEAAWLSHALVDGLTPAHHYPYEEKLVELRSGRDKESRNSLANKLIMPGESRAQQIGNNWQMWGPKGLMTTHAAFEWGVAILMAPQTFRGANPTKDMLDQFQVLPVGQWFRAQAQAVARLEFYDTFYKTGWTIPLARRVRRQLAPMLIQAVTIIWYGALLEAKKDTRS